MSIRVMIADDHDIVVNGLKVLLSKKTHDISIESTYSTGKKLLKEEIDDIDIYLIDVNLPDISGIDLAEKLLDKDPQKKIIIFSAHSEKTYIEKALEIGIKGYFLKDDSHTNLIEAIREVNSGGTYFSQKITNFVINKFMHRNSSKTIENKLTNREIEILKLITEGLSKVEISEKLQISPNTVNIHRKNLMGKLKIHNAIELTKYAIREGIITL